MNSAKNSSRVNSFDFCHKKEIDDNHRCGDPKKLDFLQLKIYSRIKHKVHFNC